MKTFSVTLAGLVVAAAPALAQTDPHAGHTMPAPTPDAYAGHHSSPSSPADEEASPPPFPSDHDADRYFPPAAMDAARAQLRREHGRVTWSKATLEKLELRSGSGPAGYAWEGQASFGGDIDRVLIKSRGEGDRRLDRAEAELLWSRAVSPGFNLEAGVRQDLQSRGRTYATAGVDGRTPYEFDVSAALFLSDKGDLSARLEGAHDYRLTQRLIVEPRAELNFAAQDVPDQGIGSGLSSLEAGLRLRYAITPQVAPYVGVEHQRDMGATARLTRAAGRDARETRWVVGLRTWF